METRPAPAVSGRFPSTALQHYVRSGFRRVEGWLSPLDARLVVALGAAQRMDGVSGAVGEIGVHHGRLFLLLYLMLAEGERAFALDVFERQDLNVDRSGRGDLERFLGNVRRFAGDTAPLEVIRASSTEVTGRDLLARTGQQVRLFSIDGGHTAEITRNDLDIADDVLAEDGAVIIDDYFNRDWPGVSEGLGAFMTARPGRLAAFVVGENKVFLCRPPARARYIAHFQEQAPALWFKKSADFYGQGTLVFHRPVSIYERLAHIQWLRALANEPILNGLKPYLRRVLD